MTTASQTFTQCPSWCVAPACIGDHWSRPGGERWPAVRATAYGAEGTPDLTAHPTWGECDELAPAVGLWIEDKDFDKTIDMTPAEAVRLATRLLAAVEAVRAG